MLVKDLTALHCKNTNQPLNTFAASSTCVHAMSSRPEFKSCARNQKNIIIVAGDKCIIILLKQTKGGLGHAKSDFT